MGERMGVYWLVIHASLNYSVRNNWAWWHACVSEPLSWLYSRRTSARPCSSRVTVWVIGSRVLNNAGAQRKRARKSRL